MKTRNRVGLTPAPEEMSGVGVERGDGGVGRRGDEGTPLGVLWYGPVLNPEPV